MVPLLNDLTGNGRNGTFSGTLEWGTGRNGSSLILGSGDNVNIDNQIPIQGVSQLTLSAWMKRSGQYTAVLLGKEEGSGANSVALGYWTDGLLYFGLSGSGGWTGGSVAQNDNDWHHITMVFDGTETGNTSRLKAYVDGVPVTLSFTGTIPVQTTTATNPFGIGSHAGYDSSGQIDDVRVYTRALSPSEVVSDMNTALGGTTTPTPTLSLTATPASITTGQSSTLAWSSTNATSCTATGGWTGSRTTSGTLSVSPTTNTTYGLACTGAGGTATQSVTVSVSTVTPDTTAPTAPGTPTVTALSASSLGLSWSASSDAVGVTGYRVERCQGATCTNYTQVATPITASYTDTGLTAATTYRYRVRATDQAGNLSAYSSVSSGVTNSVLA